MNLLYRIGYYLIGFSVGLIFLTFVFSGKKTSCNYSPTARVKSNLLQKKFKLSFKLQNQYPQINDSVLRKYIEEGNIDFSRSETQLDSCRIYHIDFENNENFFLKVSNCEKILEVINAKFP